MTTITRHWRVKLNVDTPEVPWIEPGGIHEGEVVLERVGVVRLYAPEGAPGPPYYDVLLDSVVEVFE